MSKNHIEQAEKLINCLKVKNYFEHSKRNAQENLEKVKPETLFMYAIVVEKSFNVDKVTFEYIPERGGVVRTDFTGNLKYETQYNYKSQHSKCRLCVNPCYKEKYKVEDFIDLIKRGVFEPVELYII